MKGKDFDLELAATSGTLEGTSYVGRVLGIPTIVSIRHPEDLDEFYIMLDMGTGPTFLGWDDIKFTKSASLDRWTQIAYHIAHQMLERAPQHIEDRLAQVVVEIAQEQAKIMGWEIRS